MSSIFLSHSSKDSQKSVEIRDWLSAIQFDSVFLDFDPADGIPAGRNWEQELYQRLRRCHAVIVLCSEHSMSSDWCLIEISHARALGKHLFPVVVAPCTLRSNLTDVQIIDMTKDPEGGFQRLQAGLIQAGLDPKKHFKWRSDRPPYPGLLAFQEEDAAVFFGRDDSVRECLDKLNNLRRFGGLRMVTILGASGSGKSSLVRAGIVPRLKRDAESWLIISPIRRGLSPCDELARTLSTAFSQHGGNRDWRAIRDELRQAADQEHADGGELIQLAHDLRLTTGRRNATVVLIVDQFEELLNVDANGEGDRFLSLLRVVLETPGSPFVVLITLRSDYLGNFQTHPVLREFPFEKVMVSPLTVAGYREVIEGPAEVAAVNLERGLTDLMVEDTKTGDALPLLAFTLRELWEACGKDKLLKIDDYHHTLGGLKGSVRLAAETAIRATQLSNDQKHGLRRAFLAMTHINEEGQFARRVARWHDLPEISHEVLRRFVEARLLISGKENGTVEVAHEALLREWPLLNRWLDDGRKFLLWRRRLFANLEEYDRSRTLLRDAPLSEAEQILNEQYDDLSERERAFVKSSLQQRQSEQNVERTRRRSILGGLAAGLLIAIGLAGWAAIERETALENERQAKHATNAALSALARFFAAEANSEGLRGKFQLRTLLAAQAASISDYTTATDAALRDALSDIGGRPLHGHENFVSTVVFGPNGHTLISASNDTTIRSWDIRQPHAEPKVLAGHAAEVETISLSSDGRTLASGSQDGTILLWDLAASRPEPRTLSTLEGPVQGIAFSPNGRTVAASQSRVIRLWDIDHPQSKPRELRFVDGVGRRLPVSALAFSLDGNTLASAHLDRIALWDLRDAEPVPRTLGYHQQFVSALVFIPDGRNLASAGGSKIQLWSMQQAQSTPTKLSGHTGNINALAVSPNGSTLAFGSEDKTIGLWNLSKPQDKPTLLRGHASGISALAISSDGQVLASAGGWDRSIRLWELALPMQPEPRVVLRLDKHDSARALALSTVGHTLAMASGRLGKVQLWNLERLQDAPITLAGNADTVYTIVISADGRTLAAGSEDKMIRLWDLAQPHVPPRILTGHKGTVSSLAISPDGNTLASGSRPTQLEHLADSEILLWELNQRDPIPQELSGHDGPILSLSITPDGRNLFSSGVDRTMRRWNLEQPHEAGHVLKRKDEGSTSSLAVSRDGRILAFADTSSVWLWSLDELEQEQEPQRLGGHLGGDSVLAISSDGQVLAFAGHADGAIQIWDLRHPDASPVLMHGHNGPVHDLAISSDGRTLISSGDNTVRLWQLLREDLVELACLRAGRNFTTDEWRQYMGDTEYRATCPQLPSAASSTSSK